MRQREGSAKLSKKITIVQYPDKYVTAFTSSGFLNSYDNTKKGPQPDFRFHIHLGTTPDGVPQTNTTLYKIKVLVPQKDERVGPPFFNYSGNTDLYLKTKKDEATNQVISPEFIISSQYGLSIPLPQYDKNSNVWSRHKNKPFYSFADGYGPLYGYGAHHRYRRYSTYYYNSIQYLTNETTYNGEYGAEDRCYHYFEDEYGADSSEYWENFINADGVVASGKVDKKFKYKGRWRLPTVAELRHINKIQNKQGSVVKGLLGGDLYWTGQEGVAFSLKQNRTVRPKDNLAYVRCVFDTWYHK